MKTQAQIVGKYLRGVQGGGQAYVDGIAAVDQNPADKAIARKDFWQSQLMKAFSEGSYEAGLSHVTLPGWKAAAQAGQQKYVGSAQQASAKFSEFVGAAIPVWEQARQAAASMPRGTDADALAIVANNMQIMKTLKGKRAGRRR